MPVHRHTDGDHEADRRGKKPLSTPTGNHFHHTLLRMGLGVRGSVAVILIISCIFCCLAVAGILFPIPEHVLFLAFAVLFHRAPRTFVPC
ncbi:MAG: hypothetical protein MZV70_66105 [Desulfobacterales bacterium]|nr:hypothetical protein [Desulfobacterales bacterium]